MRDVTGYLAVDAMSAGAHKFFSPKGVGFLYLRARTRFLPYLTGGSHEGGRRAGTENVRLIVGMATAPARMGRIINCEYGIVNC